MDSLNITQVIREVCKKHRIPYYSPNQGQVTVLQDDVVKLEEQFLKVKEIVRELEKIKIRHSNLVGFTQLINKIIKELQDVDKLISLEEDTLITIKKKLKKMGR